MVIGSSDGVELFLIGCILDLKFDMFFIEFNGVDFEVDIDCGDEGWGEGVFVEV